VLCWVALDRAIQLALQLGEHANVEHWTAERDEIREATNAPCTSLTRTPCFSRPWPGVDRTPSIQIKRGALVP
jgi:GH15 family glucan-1,4-alpha-glucosidase